MKIHKPTIIMLGVAWVLVITYSVHELNNAEYARKHPTQTTTHAWTVADSKAYAQQGILKQADKEFSCLVKLWGKESAWDSKAFNPVKVGGLNAGGIPQILGMSTKLTPASQIDRGLKYIYHRYPSGVCQAWNHWNKKGWY